ncbi:WYL domain-containing protein [Eubacterium sp.]|uniref:WYL domain-containing protein n=1 Tax=Eubacterium sp. TaxID=142586 RepID=UPI00399A2D84
MAYSELIKKFDKVRNYMRDFYAYGFHTRNDFDKKSARSYDNERRRIESWLSDYMNFRQQSGGKQIFFSVDSRKILHNPLYRAYKAKSFTDKDIVLHFYIMDILADEKCHSFKEIAERVYSEYLSFFDTDMLPDESTIRNKVKEYVDLGLINEIRQGNGISHKRGKSVYIGEDGMDAVAFAAEETPVGVVGSFILDKYNGNRDYFSFKHRYMMEALEQQIIVDILLCKKRNESIELTMKSSKIRVFPLKIYISTQNGRQYLMGYYYRERRPAMYRIDNIEKIRTIGFEKNHQLYDSYGDKFGAHMWGVSSGKRDSRILEHLKMTINIEEGEEFIINRLMREKRCGTVTRANESTVEFEADVYSAQEMMPWIRTFIGRIEKLECSNHAVEKVFYDDLEAMYSMYQGEKNDI